MNFTHAKNEGAFDGANPVQGARLSKQRMVWLAWGFRRGIASNLYELGANEKIVQRVVRRANPHVTKDRCIKAFDPAVLAAMKSLETTLGTLEMQSAIIVQQAN